MPAPVIDWVVAEWVARQIAGGGLADGGSSGRGLAGRTGRGRADEPPWPALDLAPLALDAERRVVAYTGLTPGGPLPVPEGISRQEWVASNIASTRALLDPVISRAGDAIGPATRGAQLWLGATASAEVGAMIGYLGKRVLGQYEVVLLEQTPDSPPPRLLLVLPNLGRAVRRCEADEREFVTWVTLHEVTHAVQFGAVSWLQPYLAGIVGELLRGAERRLQSGTRLRVPSRAAVERFGRAAVRADMVAMFANESERELIDQAQAVMAVIEGHAEHVMDAVAPELLPSLPAMRAAIDARRRSGSPISRLLARLLGLELKLKQYERGKVFCDAIVREGGTDALAYVFSAPAALPSLAEIEAPRRWLDRARPDL